MTAEEAEAVGRYPPAVLAVGEGDIAGSKALGLLLPVTILL